MAMSWWSMFGRVAAGCLVLGVVGPIVPASADPDDDIDPTELWLGKRWDAILVAREARRLSSSGGEAPGAKDRGAGSGAGSGGGGAAEANGGSEGGTPDGTRYELPIYWAVSSADAPTISSGGERRRLVRGRVGMLYESSFGRLPHRLTDWFRPTVHDSVRDWQSSFRGHLDAHLDECRRDITRFSREEPDRILILDYEAIPLSWTSAMAWMVSHAHDWEETVRLINSPTIDPDFARMAGVGLEVETWGELERRGLADAFMRDTYNGFVRVVVGSTLGLLRADMPEGVRLGVYGAPVGQINVASYARASESRIRQHNDELAWLFAETDVLAMSLYNMPLLDPRGVHPHGLRSHGEDEVEHWYRINMGEAHRIRDTYAPEAEILPFVWYHYHDHSLAGRLSDGRIPMLTAENAEAQLRHIDAFGGDGVILWGTTRPYYVRRGHASELDVLGHLKRYWLPHLQLDRATVETSVIGR